MLLTCCLCFAIIWDIANPSLSCSIIKCLIYSNKWVANADSSSIFKPSWTCTPSCLTWFRWMKHKFDTCLSKYNVLMVNLALHPLFIKPPHFSWNLVYPYGLSLMRLLVHWCSIFLELHCDFVVISFTTFVKSLEPYWHWYLQTTSQPILCYLWTYIAL
jgi:hypothetical protein